MSRWPHEHPRSSVVVVLVVLVAAVWVVKVARVAGSVERNAAYWSHPRGAPGGLLYVALGDSAAQGVGASRPDRGYVGLLAQRLRERTGRPVEVVNLSRSGARIHDVLDTQLPALAALCRAPDVLTVGIGGNDMASYDRQVFAAAMERLTAALATGAYVADVPYFMHGRSERDAQQAANLVRSSAIRHGLRPVALHATLRAQGRRAMFTQFAADGFHPNDRGHGIWADAFWQELTHDPVLSAPNTAALGSTPDPRVCPRFG